MPVSDAVHMYSTSSTTVQDLKVDDGSSVDDVGLGCSNGFGNGLLRGPGRGAPNPRTQPGPACAGSNAGP